MRKENYNWIWTILRTFLAAVDLLRDRFSKRRLSDVVHQSLILTFTLHIPLWIILIRDGLLNRPSLTRIYDLAMRIQKAFVRLSRAISWSIYKAGYPYLSMIIPRWANIRPRLSLVCQFYMFKPNLFHIYLKILIQAQIWLYATFTLHYNATPSVTRFANFSASLVWDHMRRVYIIAHFFNWLPKCDK